MREFTFGLALGVAVGFGLSLIVVGVDEASNKANNADCYPYQFIARPKSPYGKKYLLCAAPSGSTTLVESK